MYSVNYFHDANNEKIKGHKSKINKMLSWHILWNLKRNHVPPYYNVNHLWIKHDCICFEIQQEQKLPSALVFKTQRANTSNREQKKLFLIKKKCHGGCTKSRLSILTDSYRFVTSNHWESLPSVSCIQCWPIHL